MRFTLLIIAASMFLAACSHQSKPQELSGDAKLRHQITGVWLSDNGVVTFLPDGYSSARYTNGARELAYESAWDVSNGDIIITVTSITSNTTNHEPVGSVERLRVVKIDSTNFVWESSDGFKMILARKP